MGKRRTSYNSKAAVHYLLALPDTFRRFQPLLEHAGSLVHAAGISYHFEGGEMCIDSKGTSGS